MKEHIFVDNGEQKECSKCEVYKDIALFNKDKTKKDGLYSCCKKCSSIKDKATYNKDPEKKKAKTKAYAKLHKENYKRPYNPEYYQTETAKRKKRARDLRRRMLKKDADKNHIIVEMDILNLLEKYEGKCAYCNKYCAEDYHIDHKLPLFHGGDNSYENLALSCPHCNLSKGTLTDVEFVGVSV